MDPNILHSSPEELQRLYEIEDKIHSKKNEITWSINSYVLDRRSVIYITHVSISMIMILFCMYQLVMLEGCHSQQLYSSLLTLVIGIYLPSPSVPKI
jgi:hypothetical protein